MELLTSSQRQLLLDFKERVRQHETKMKSLNLNNNILVTLGQEAEGTETIPHNQTQKNQTFEPNQLLLNQKSPEREINPNSVLKTIVFNSTPSGVKKQEASPSPGQFKSTSYYPISDENRFTDKDKSRILVEDQFDEGSSKLDVSHQNDKRDFSKNEREENLSKIYYSSPHSRMQDDSKFFTNESYSEKLDNYLKVNTTTNQSRIQKDPSNTSFSSKQRLQVPSISKPENNLSLNTSNTYDNRYKAYQMVEEETKANFLTFIPKVGSSSATNLVSKSVAELLKPTEEFKAQKTQQALSKNKSPIKRGNIPAKPEPKPKEKRSNSASQRPKTAASVTTTKPAKKVSFDESHKKPEYVTTKTTDGRKRWKLGTVNQKKLKDIIEDQMFFSARFLENIKNILKEKS